MLVVFIAGGTVAFSRTQPPATAPDRTPTAVLAHALKRLADEAEQSRRNGTLVRGSPTFASEVGQALPGMLVLDRLTKRIDEDPFIDAYVRWQLTGFDIPEFAQTDAAFDRLLRSLPALLLSPRADAAIIDTLSRASQAGRLTSRQREDANSALNNLAARTSAAQSLNVPGLEFRAWVIKRCEPSRPDRAILVAMERAAALAAAGWPNEDAKREVDSMIEKSARRREFTAAQRQEVLQRAGELVSTGRMFVVSAGISGEALAVDYSMAGIFDFDVRRWERLLRE
jgi:hypothetical protein